MKKSKKTGQNTLLSDALDNNKKLDKMFLAATAAGPKRNSAGGVGGIGVAPSLSIGQQLGQNSKSQQVEGQADALLEDILGDLDCNTSDKDLQRERSERMNQQDQRLARPNLLRNQPMHTAPAVALPSRPFVKETRAAQPQRMGRPNLPAAHSPLVGTERERKVHFEELEKVKEEENITHAHSPPLMVQEEEDE